MTQLPRPPRPTGPQDQLPADRGRTQYFDVDCKVAALLCYMPVCLLNIVVAGFWLNTEPRSNRFLRLHAYQGILLTLVFIALAGVMWVIEKILSFIPFLSIFGFLGHIAWFGLCAVFMILNLYVAYNCLQSETVLLPYIGEFADQNSM